MAHHSALAWAAMPLPGCQHGIAGPSSDEWWDAILSTMAPSCRATCQTELKWSGPRVGRLAADHVTQPFSSSTRAQTHPVSSPSISIAFFENTGKKHNPLENSIFFFTKHAPQKNDPFVSPSVHAGSKNALPPPLHKGTLSHLPYFVRLKSYKLHLNKRTMLISPRALD